MLNQNCVEMEEKKTITENKMSELLLKLEWEVPMLISLDKGKTEGGDRVNTYEYGSSYYNAS